MCQPHDCAMIAEELEYFVCPFRPLYTRKKQNDEECIKGTTGICVDNATGDDLKYQ